MHLRDKEKSLFYKENIYMNETSKQAANEGAERSFSELKITYNVF